MDGREVSTSRKNSLESSAGDCVAESVVKPEREPTKQPPVISDAELGADKIDTDSKSVDNSGTEKNENGVEKDLEERKPVSILDIANPSISSNVPAPADRL